MNQATAAAPATPAAPQLFTLQIPAIGADWPEHGGKFGGIVFADDGKPQHLIIVGPEAPEEMTHKEALAWVDTLPHAAFMPWDIPTCIEGHILAANRAALDFKREWYWLKERHAEDSICAWCQSFYYGRQLCITHIISLRARAVRRLAIQ